MAKDDGDDQIVREGKTRFEYCLSYEASARANAKFDRRFALGDAINLGQWDQAVRTARGDRPTITDNQVRVNNLLIVNDARQNKSQIKVTPTGGHATFEAAQVFSGVIRRIEYQSKAVDAYSTGIYHQVESGIGYARVVTEYADETSFDQDIFIRRVADPGTIYLDPDARDYDKADMRYAFVFEDIARDLYEAEHGKDDMPASALDAPDPWNTEKHIRIAEYWRRGVKDDKLLLMHNGDVLRDSDLPAGDVGALVRSMVVKERDVATPQIEWFKIVGNRIDERKSWAGRYIPIVPFIGEESIIDGVMDRKGHTRSQIDAQRMVNYWTSAAVEQVALQGKAPYLAAAEAIEGHSKYWDTANTTNWPYLPYNAYDETGQKIDKPERQAPPEMAQAYLHGLQMAKDALMFVTGQYQANRGAPSNETSGVAIQQRQRAGDAATYHFIDNQAKAIRQVGRIVLDLIPHVYDVARVTKIMAEDGSESDVHIDPQAQAAHQHVAQTPQGPQPITPDQATAFDNDPQAPDVRVIFNPNVGRYDVEADVGPAFATRRQEAFNALTEIIKASPDLVKVVGDMLFKSADFPLADEIAERLRRGVPQQYLGGPTMAETQLQQALEQTQQNAHATLGKADAEVAQLKQTVEGLQQQLKDKAAELVIKDYAAETDRLKAVGSIDPAALQIIVRQMVENMMNTQIAPMLARHAAFEQSLQPEPAEAEPAAAS